MRVVTTRRTIKRRTLVSVLLFATLATLTTSFYLVAYASTSTTTLRPDSIVSSSGWLPTPSGAGTNHLRLDEATPDTADYVGAGGAATDEYGMTNVSSGEQTATNVRVRVYMTRQTSEGCLLGLGTPIPAQLTMNIRVGGLQTAFSTEPTGANGSYAWYERDFPGVWSQTDIDNLQVQVSKNTSNGGCVLGLGNNATFRIATVEAKVTWFSPEATQSTWRIYENTNATSPGAPLGGANTLTDVARSSQFRVRLGLKVSDYNWQTGSWGAHGNLYKLQYVARGLSGTCATPNGTWTDIGTTSPIRWYDNSGVANPSLISAITNDPPITSGAKTPQAYRESNSFGLSVATLNGNTAIWDFSLAADSTATPGYYCLRIVKNNNTPLFSYDKYPEIAITGDYNLGIVNSSGTDVVSPFVNFPLTNVSTTECNISSAVLGTSSQKLRINNDLKKNGWNVTMAATNGSGSLWSSGASHYDYNDPTGATPGCEEGGDADAYAGQLRVNAGSAAIVPKSGCTSTGVSLGSNAKFSQGSVDTITIVSANASAARFCYWDLTGIQLEQRIPPRTPAGSYSLDMTLTMTAL